VFCGIVTDGPNPGSILYRGRRYKAVPPQIKVVNPIGSGDSPLAGLVDDWLYRLEPEALFRHAMASAVANAMVWDAVAIEPGAVARWSERVIIEPLAAAGRWQTGYLLSAAVFVCLSAFKTCISSRISLSNCFIDSRSCLASSRCLLSSPPSCVCSCWPDASFMT
jgi:hypothetical protein